MPDIFAPIVGPVCERVLPAWLAAFGGNQAAAMLAPYANGLAIDFRDGSMVIKDTATPANSFVGPWSGKLAYTGAGPVIDPANGIQLVGSGTTLAALLTSVMPMSQNAGTLFADVTTAVEDGANKTIIGFTDGAATNRTLIRREIGGNLAGFIVQASAFTGTPTKQLSADLTRYKIGFSWALNAAEFAVNGVSTAPDTSFTPPTAVTQFMIGRENGSQHFTGHIARVLWVPQALSAAQLQALTA